MVQTVANSPQVINFEGREDITDFSFLGEYSEEERKAVTELSLNSTEVTSLNGIEKLPNLQNINLGGLELDNLSALENFAGTLTSLRLTNVAVTQADVDNVLSKLTELEALYIDDNFGEGKVQNVAGLSSLTSLKKVSIAGNKQINSLDGVSNWSELEDLDISGTGIRNLEQAGQLKALKSLTLKDLDGLSATALSPLNSLQQLDKLYVDETLNASANGVLVTIRNKNSQLAIAL